MRRLVSMLSALALAGCAGGGGARTVLPGTSVSVAPGASSGAASTASSGGIGLGTHAIQFDGTGWSAMQVVTTTWSDASRKTAVSSDETVVTVSPPYQLAHWTAPGTFTASYYVTPVGAGTATITFSDHGGAESTLLKVTVKAPPSGTLYVAAASEVDAFPAAANGLTAPQRRISGFYHPFNPLDKNGRSAAAVAVAPEGTLNIALNYQRGECDVFLRSATADGTSGGLPGFSCTGTRGYGVAAAPGGAIDILVLGYGGAAAVQRFQSGNLTSTLSVPDTFGAPQGLAIDGSGHIFVSSYTAAQTINSHVLEYASDASGNAAPVRTIPPDAGAYFQSIAAAPDGTLYATSVVFDYSNGRETDTIDVFPPGATSPRHKIGPFSNDVVAALAVDKGGELYVAFNGPNARVDVYAARACGCPAAVRSIPHPIPADAVDGSGIVSLALSPPDGPPPEQVLGRRRHN